MLGVQQTKEDNYDETHRKADRLSAGAGADGLHGRGAGYACKHSTYRLSQSPFFPLYQGDNLRFPVLSKPLLYILTIETTKSSGKNHFPIQTQLRQDSISYSTIFLRISPTIVGFIWVFALFRCEDNFFVSLL